MSVQALDIANALQLRMQQISPSNGYLTDAGLRVHIARTQFDPKVDQMPLVTILLPKVTPERVVVGTQTYHVSAEFSLVGLIRESIIDLATNPLWLQADIESAATNEAPADTLLALISDLEWIGSEIADPIEGVPEAQITVRLQISWDTQLKR